MYNHGFISVLVGKIRPNGEGNLSLISRTAAEEILPAYSAGAHIDVIIPGVGPRQYSLCSAPDRSNTYEICVRLIGTSTSGSRYLYQRAKSSDRLAISPPCNHLPLPEVGRYLLFVSGTGIMPLLAMAEAIATRKGAPKLHCYVANSRQMVFSPCLTQLAAGGTMAIHCSEEDASFRQRIPAHLATPDSDTAVVTCGPEGSIQQLQSVMEKHYWSSSQSVFERFTPVMENNTAAKNAFYIELASSRQHLQVAANQIIAQVLQHAGVEVILPCKQGMRGSCTTGALDGTPEYRGSMLAAEERAGNDQATLCCLRVRLSVLVLDL